MGNDLDFESMSKVSTSPNIDIIVWSSICHYVIDIEMPEQIIKHKQILNIFNKTNLCPTMLHNFQCFPLLSVRTAPLIPLSLSEGHLYFHSDLIDVHQHFLCRIHAILLLQGAANFAPFCCFAIWFCATWQWLCLFERSIYTNLELHVFNDAIVIWQSSQLTDDAFQWIPEFLKFSRSIRFGTCQSALVRKSWTSTRDPSKNIGEFSIIETRSRMSTSWDPSHVSWCCTFTPPRAFHGTCNRSMPFSCGNRTWHRKNRIAGWF